MWEIVVHIPFLNILSLDLYHYYLQAIVSNGIRGGSIRGGLI
jgi:hypothetical protein